MNATIQTPKQATWRDADGQEVPYKFIPSADRVKESLAGSLLKKAVKLEQLLLDFYDDLKAGFDKVYNQMLEDYKLRYNKDRKIKGSYSWYNFDKSIKIESRISDMVKWDEAMMNEARELLDSYLSQNLTAANELIRGLVQSAFHNTKGMIDTGKVFQILKYEERIRHKDFQKACKLMRNAQSVANSKRYMIVSVKEDDGTYRAINLNFSSI
ncbi:DUF3164 family protein [Niabella insulamsoli]|uniref:DUF3164 family protein n=1 Tax=Niabella insulamsoli TaxID=3144874 RepID=UPI0031FDD454